MLSSIDPDKDADGLHPLNLGRLVKGEEGPRSCTPAGVMALLDRYGIPIEGKRVVVIGRSILVGKPMALMLQALLPSRRVPMRPLIPGALMIGTLLTILNLTVSRSILSLGSRFQAYGFIGGVLVLTLWVWMIGVIIYYGQCWSVVLASMANHRHGDPYTKKKKIRV